MTQSSPLNSSEFRAIVETPGRRARATATAFVVAAIGFFVYEATKSLIFPKLSLWESHSITIFFGSCVAAIAAYAAMQRQATILARLASEAGRREWLETRQAALAESEAKYRQLVEASPEAIAVHRQGQLVYANSAASTLIGATAADTLIGRQVFHFVHRDDVRTTIVSHRRGSVRQHYRLVCLDGSVRHVDSASVAISHEGRPALQTVFRDVTEHKRLEAQLQHEAYHDSLTALSNRARFRLRVEEALARTVGNAKQNMAVLFLDLDDFKRVNDSLGHEAGDQLLRAVASRLLAETRTYDTVARLGGDEFAILLERLENPEEVITIVDRIQDAVRRPLELSGRQISVSASIGVAYSNCVRDVDTMLRNADVAMYAAKDAGKERHAVYEDSMHAAIVERLQLENDLRLAVVDPIGAGLYLAYQPIVHLGTGEISSMEALVRWEHPQRGAIAPAVFVPVAEQTGAIVSLGAWILEEACRQLVAWRTLWWRERRSAAALPSIAVNISGRQLTEFDFADQVAAILRRTGAPPQSITLEITETVIMNHSEDSLRTLQALKGLGLRLAIDDFGTGYSSLSYLQRFPVDVLKIDRAFVEGVQEGGSDTALARTIIALGQTLGLRTVAEGVELESQRRALHDMGCMLGQGYLFSPALRADDLTAWMRQHDVRSLQSAAV